MEAVQSNQSVNFDAYAQNLIASAQAEQRRTRELVREAHSLLRDLKLQVDDIKILHHQARDYTYKVAQEANLLLASPPSATDSTPNRAA